MHHIYKKSIVNQPAACTGKAAYTCYLLKLGTLVRISSTTTTTTAAANSQFCCNIASSNSAHCTVIFFILRNTYVEVQCNWHRYKSKLWDR